jgi:hypothetical protein
MTVPASAATGVTNIQVSGNKVTAKVELPGNLSADLELQFEQAVGLTADSLGLSARVVDPGDLNITSRLPASVSVPAAFPVLIAIDPPGSSPLSFSGTVSINLHTHNLTYLANSPLRLFTAETGKKFQDVTASAGLGSYRTGGNKGGFSEFLILADIRPVDAVIADKFQRLQAKLDANAGSIAAGVLPTIQTALTAARNAYLANDAASAAEKIQQFAELVKQNSGAAIPDVWRATRDVVNVAGELRSGASTLRFSLLLKASVGG